MADLARTVSIIFTGEDRLSVAVNGIERKFAEIGSEAEGAGRKIGGLGKDLDDVGKKSAGVDLLKNALSGLGAALVFQAFIDSNVALERFERSMTSVTGSSALASKEFDYVREVAQRLGLELFDTADNYSSLAAATKGTSLEGEASRRIFEAVSNAMATLGRSSADTGGALLAITQIVSKGRVSMEELTGQLGERLPGALQIAARGMNLTTEALIALVEDGGLTAEEFLPRFAEALNATFGGGGSVEGFEANLNRLKNSFSEAFLVIGNTGSFELFSNAVGAGARLIAGYLGGIQILTEKVAAYYRLLQTGNQEQFNREMTTIAVRAEAAGAAINGDLNESLAETARLLRDANTLAEANSGQSAAETARLIRQTGESTKAIAEVDRLLKSLGVKPQAIVDVGALARAFEELVNNPRASGDQMLAGFEAALKRVKDLAGLNTLGSALSDAFAKGSISAGDFDKAVALLTTRQNELTGATGKASSAAKSQADSLKKNEEAATKARESAEKYALEMEKLASNERIAVIEAKVKLDIANVEANARTAIAAFESINTTIESTGGALGDLFKLFGNSALSFSEQSLIREQIDLENKRRDEALAPQKKLTEAQINNIMAQTRVLDRGDALIKIDGAGLQPHLEAFMFEVLRAIQTRVNQQGLDLLLGMPLP